MGGEGFAVDASMIKADANRQRSVPGAEWLAPEAANHAVREYLAVLEDAAFGAATPVGPKFVSPADPASRRTGAKGGVAFFAYCTNYLIDLKKRRVIVDVEASTAVRQAEVTAQQRMIDRTQERFGLWPERLAADAAYGSAENLAWLVHERGIEPHIPIFDKSQRSEDTFSRDDFVYDPRHDPHHAAPLDPTKPFNMNPIFLDRLLEQLFGAHLVLRQGAGLVGADDRRGSAPCPGPVRPGRR